MEVYRLINDKHNGCRQKRITVDLLSGITYLCRKSFESHTSHVVALNSLKAFFKKWQCSEVTILLRQLFLKDQYEYVGIRLTDNGIMSIIPLFVCVNRLCLRGLVLHKWRQIIYQCLYLYHGETAIPNLKWSGNDRMIMWLSTSLHLCDFTLIKGAATSYIQ